MKNSPEIQWIRDLYKGESEESLIAIENNWRAYEEAVKEAITHRILGKRVLTDIESRDNLK